MLNKRNNEVKDQDCVKYLTTSDKILLSLLLIVITLCLALFGFTASLLIKTKPSCGSINCIKSVTNLLDSADFTLKDRCRSFYEFVCGNFIRDSIEKNKNSPFEEEINIINYQRTRALTKHEYTNKFYQTCINSANENDIILNLLEKVDGWPLVLGQNWQKNYTWFQFIMKLQDLNFPSEWFIDFKLDTDTNHLKISSPKLPLSTTYNNYSEVLFDISNALGASEIMSYYQIKQVEQFEKDLIQCTIHKKHEYSMELTLDELTELYPQIPWFELLANYSKGKINFINNTTVILNASQYLNKLNLLLLGSSHTTHINYLVWKLLEYFLPLFNETYRIKYFNRNNLERRDYCWSETYTRFENDIKKFYLKKSLQDKNLDTVNTMVEYIEDQIVIQAAKIPWIKMNFKKFAIEKIRNLQFIVDIFTEEESQNDNIFSDESTQTLMDVLQLHINLQTMNLFRALNQNVTKLLSEYLAASMQFELFFDWNKNIAIIPIELIKDFWYNENRPNYLNFASLGSIIAEQLSKELVKLLIYFNQENVNERRKIFSHILNYNETIAENTLEEEFATIVGLNLAYLAYQEWVQNHGVEQKLFGLDFDPEQLFWMQTTYVRCSRENGMSVLVNRKLQNSIKFLKDFNCFTGIKSRNIRNI